jgi:hypothetical protein
VGDEVEKIKRMHIWEGYINEDPAILKQFVAPLAESIDWVKICKAETPDTQTLYQWTRACLLMAAETSFLLQRDQCTSDSGKRMGGNKSAAALNRQWEKFIDDEMWDSRLLNIQTPVNREFGCGPHTLKKAVTVTLPEWDDSELLSNAFRVT